MTAEEYAARLSILAALLGNGYIETWAMPTISARAMPFRDSAATCSTSKHFYAYVLRCLAVDLWWGIYRSDFWYLATLILGYYALTRSWRCHGDGSAAQAQLRKLQHIQAAGNNWLPGLTADLF